MGQEEILAKEDEVTDKLKSFSISKIAAEVLSRLFGAQKVLTIIFYSNHLKLV